MPAITLQSAYVLRKPCRVAVLSTYGLRCNFRARVTVLTSHLWHASMVGWDLPSCRCPLFGMQPLHRVCWPLCLEQQPW